MFKSIEIREVYFEADDKTGDRATSYPLNSPDTEKLPHHRKQCTTWGVYGLYSGARTGEIFWFTDHTDIEKAKIEQAMRQDLLKSQGNYLRGLT